MAIDREAALKQAEKLLRQGKLDGAIAEYVRLVEDQPRDWTSINALGDLYVRAGDVDRAVAQFTKVGDYLFAEGFLPKAAALYKKALKVTPEHEHTLLRLSEIAAQQGLLADARMYLRQLGRQRRDRGDSRGAAECLVRLGMLEEADAEAKLAGARAAQALGDTRRAIALFKQAADEFRKANRIDDAVTAEVEASALDPGDPDLLLARVRAAATSGNASEAQAAINRLLAVAPQKRRALLTVAHDLAGAGQHERAFPIVEVLVDDAILGSNWDAAIDMIRSFLRYGPHIPSLMKLVELAVDTGRDDVMHAAQEQLADAYLSAGRGAEARVIAEDLVARDPASEAHADRLRRAVALLGGGDAEAIIARYREPVPAIDDVATIDDAPEPASGPDLAPAPVPQPFAGALPAPAADSSDVDDEAIVVELFEIDLSDALSGLGGGPAAPSSPPSPPAAPPAASPPDLETVFEEMRNRAARDQNGGDAAEHYERGLQHLEQDRTAEAVADLKAAARTPLFRFRAASRLGRLFVGRGEIEAGIEWLERAAEAPAPSAEETLAVLYDLATALERIGEIARALAVLMEIDADGNAYRDVRQRIDRLARAQAESSRP